jgi:SAM-dependent methyltransferase
VRPAVIDFARDVAENLPVTSPLLEVGARVADGQHHFPSVRSIFNADVHISCDIQDGPGVDQIEDIHHLSFEDGSVGTVVALETLEHVADPIRAVEEMYRVLQPGGVLAISSLMFFPIHAHPSDYWRFTPHAFELLLKPFESQLVIAQGYWALPEGVFGVAVKGVDLDLAPDRLPRTHSAAQAWGRDLPVDFGPIRMTVRQLWGHTLRYSAQGARRKVGRYLGRRS